MTLYTGKRILNMPVSLTAKLWNQADLDVHPSPTTYCLGDPE